MSFKKTKIAAIFVSIGILTLLFMIGPIQAFILKLTVSDTSISVGDELTTIIDMEIEEEEILDVNYFLIDLSGPISISCMFLPDGTKISSCNGITIEDISDTGFQYGYGYTQGHLTYKITFNTGNYPPGIYNTKIISFVGEEIIVENGPEIVINSEHPLLESCSIRAKEGNLEVDEINFEDKGKLSFNIPKGNSVNGKGSLIAQYNRKRVSYKFDVVEILSNNEDSASIRVSGEYKINGNEKISETAIINIDKVNKKVSLIGNDIISENMEITFIRGCA